MWKDFFYYSKSERRAIIVLLVLAAVVLSGILFGKRFGGHSSVVRQSASAEIDSFIAQIKDDERRRFADAARFNKRKEEPVPVILQPFDPNTVDSMSLRRLGLSAFVARNVLRYRASGGVFRAPEAFARIYGLADSQFLALKPYIRISSEFTLRRDTLLFARQEAKSDSVPFKYPEGTVVPLNKADTSQLKRIPGIGSGLARMIVAYRNKLGGFCRVEQLQEVPHIGPDFNRWFVLDEGPYRKLRVNRDGLDRLRSHPYMDFYKAKAILEYRRKRGRIKGMSQIEMFKEFSEADIRRLSPYLSFD